jgi:hypothetical protein
MPGCGEGGRERESKGGRKKRKRNIYFLKCIYATCPLQVGRESLLINSYLGTKIILKTTYMWLLWPYQKQF